MKNLKKETFNKKKKI